MLRAVEGIKWREAGLESTPSNCCEEMPFKDVNLVTKNLDCATTHEVRQLEEQIRFPLRH